MSHSTAFLLTNLFLPKLRQESVKEEMSPGRPVVTGFADAVVLIFDSVLFESIPEVGSIVSD